MIFSRPLAEIPEFRPMHYFKQKQEKLMHEKYLKLINSTDVSELEKLVLDKVRYYFISQSNIVKQERRQAYQPYHALCGGADCKDILSTPRWRKT